jgi:hypothetical protein
MLETAGILTSRLHCSERLEAAAAPAQGISPFVRICLSVVCYTDALQYAAPLKLSNQKLIMIS